MNIDLESNVEGVEAADTQEVIKGLPSMCLLPAADYSLVLGKNNYVITVPKKGRFEDVIKGDDKEAIEGFSGEFMVYEDEGKVFYPPTFTAVALAMKLYPKLKSDSVNFQVFSIKAILPDETSISVIGEIVNLVIGE